MYSGCVCFAWLQARAAIRASVAAEASDAGQGRSQPVGVAVAVEWVAEHGQRRML